MEPSSFPSIEVSFRFHPPTALFTLAAPTPSMNYKPAPTCIGFPSVVTDGPFAWLTSYIPHHSPSPESTTTLQALSAHVPKITTAMIAVESSHESDGTTTGGPKIGMAIGITIAVILSITIIALAIMDYRHRFKRRRGKKQNCDSLMKGVWVGLRVEDIGHERMTRKGSKRDGLWGKEWMGSKIALLERVGEGKQEKRDRTEPDWLPEWIPAYLPKDRRSVGLEESTALSMMEQPVVPMGFLRKETR
jgi:hypothetical protein